MIAVTGASGHLGQAIMALLPDALPIGRVIPDTPVAALIHAAAPSYKDNTQVNRFHAFNQQLLDYITRHAISRIVTVGSWWQYADGNCRTLPYTELKNTQAVTFPGTHVIPYSIYGDDARPGRGFIPQLINALTTEIPLLGLSNEPRDFIHVTDVAHACITALDAEPGTYSAATRHCQTPRQIAEQYGLTAPDYNEYPNATPKYVFPDVPGWQARINLHEHISHSLGRGR